MEREKEKVLLKDTSLCAIVRDEIMNPAGGINDFIESTVPFVEEAVIIDTGSKDGTREALKDLQVKYNNLKIFDTVFTGFSAARNFAFGKVETSKVLVLDADERLTFSDFQSLKMFIENNKFPFYTFLINYIYTDQEEDELFFMDFPRLFEVSKDLVYRDNRANHEELLCFNEQIIFLPDEFSTGVEIKHFCIKKKHACIKNDKWYKKIVAKGLAGNISPSDIPGNSIWKAYNRRREMYR